MRHAMTNRRLGRTSGHRKALFRNQLASLIDKERIITTLIKAKELRPIAEKIITLGKKGTLHARRVAGRSIADDSILRKLFEDVAPRFSDRAGGYTRIVKLGPRRGDGAEMAILELVDFKLAAPAPVAPTKVKAKAAKAPADTEAAPSDAEEKKKPAAKKPAAKKAAPKKKDKDEDAKEKKPAKKKLAAKKKEK